ncbi:MAG: hypothetical protein AAGM84_03530 [Pseudomonadota bacterium]
MKRVATLAACAALIAACEPLEDLSEAEVLSLRPTTAQVPLRFETVDIRALLLGGGGSRTEVPGSECRVFGAGVRTLSFTAPQRVAVPVLEGAARSYTVECTGLVGPSKLTTTGTLAPRDPEAVVTPDSTGRVYPPRASVAYALPR